MVKKSGSKSGGKIGRNAGTGRFTTVSTAKGKSSTHVVETIKGKRPPDPRPVKKK